MAGLPYWTNSAAAINYYEPIFQNQFEVVLTPPAVIGGANVALLVEHVTKLSGLPEINSSGTLAEQKYKFATRSYAGSIPDKTTCDLALTFTVNLNTENDAYVYNILRAWNDIVYNPLTGSQGLKRDYVGQMSVFASNKTGEIFREWSFPSIIPNSALKAIELDYVAPEVYEATMTYRADFWTETRVGQINV
ncbi:hypothetical protein UFOVP1247_235 [uncultured Caudovirales phage]|uniref:Tail tube protein n=1 Tax=uncultured Caudovirales phage TaxID=2100421 RepID=A0A6J5RPY2_9CAUD|nr:hypothetical protein UFOVP970_275 [uncultured Caudovirales phage]CAB4193864.1 hypothetical protein UFOVP1247_235 [uncultured Caudovirales phage]